MKQASVHEMSSPVHLGQQATGAPNSDQGTHGFDGSSAPQPDLSENDAASSTGDVDPITPVLGHSIQLAELLAWRAPDGLAYVSANVRNLLEVAAGIAQAGLGATTGNPILINMAHVLQAMILKGDERSVPVSPFAQELRSLFATEDMIAGLETSEIRASMGSSIGPGSHPDGSRNVRWDVVEVLAEASRLRLLTNAAHREIGLRHVFLGAFFVKAGQVALRDCGFFRPSFDDFRAKLTTIRHREFNRYGDDLAAWDRVFADIGRQEPLVRTSGSEARASYASDRVQVEPRDPLGISVDAGALADLILLDAARPPLAIGVFGSWGSGKSTLIAHLKEQIRAQVAEERALRARGEADRNAETRRVGNVIQLDFNAWTFADSPNLWASFASEIFDQLAAGGLDQGGERHGAKLVAEVAARTSREMLSLRTATAAIAQNEAGVAAAQTALEEACQAADASILGAAADTARDLLGAKPDKPPNRLYVSFGPPEKEKDKTALATFREAVTGPATDSPEKLIARYATAAGPIVRLGQVLFDYVRASWTRSLMLTGGLVLVCLSVLWVWQALDLSRVAKALVSLPVLLLWGSITLRVMMPAIRFAALFNERLERRKREARDAIVKAETDYRTYRDALETAEQARRTSQAFIAQYGAATDPSLGTSPGLMLDYLLKESESVAAVRAREGLLAIVRRAFDQLDAVIARMRKEDPDHAIDRIILYIDDLDRCSAKQVTEILQAIHLLLAFECFVVVAAVDARWLRHSLESEHEQFAPPKPGVDPTAKLSIANGQPTAADYLEKIFQVAFWVRPLIDGDAAGEAQYAPYARYVDHLFGDSQSPHTTARSVKDEPADHAPGERPTASAFVIVAPEAPLDIDRPRRERLQITPEEQALFKKLGPLAAKSPRAVKRMINIYRLIRVGYREEALTHFLGQGSATIPSWRAVLFALACEMGLPTTLVASLDKRIRAMSDEEWQRFNETGLCETDGKPIRNDIGFGKKWPELATLAEQFGQIAMLPRFQLGLAALGEAGPSLRKGDMILALDDVRRYSFRLE